MGGILSLSLSSSLSLSLSLSVYPPLLFLSVGGVIGRSSWSERCRFNLPWSIVETCIGQDDQKTRTVSRRSNLDDDAWVKVHSLPLLVRSLMNIQINLHHPDDCSRGLSYSIKYELKSEPQTRIKLLHESDDAVIKFLDGQFVSLSAAAALVLNDPITHCTRGDSPVAFPSWSIAAGKQTEGLLSCQPWRLEFKWNVCF